MIGIVEDLIAQGLPLIVIPDRKRRPGGTQVAAMVGIATNGNPSRRATTLAVSSTAPPPTPITTCRSVPA
jgi:hypothetical protein